MSEKNSETNNFQQVLPMASEARDFPAIPDTDSFLLALKNEDSIPTYNGNKDESSADDVPSANNNSNGHVRRFSTGNISIPYTKVKILSRYLASSSTGSCHDYCKYGMRKECEETGHHHHHSSTFMKRFNDALGKGHEIFKHTATLMERRKKMSLNVTPKKTVSFKGPKTDPQLSSKRRSEVTRGANVDISTLAMNGGGHVPLRLNSPSASELAVVGSPEIAPERDVSRSVRSKTTSTLSKIEASSTSELASPKYDKYSRRSKSVSKAETSSSSSPLVDKLPTLSKVFSSSIVSEAGSDVGLRLNSPSASELAVVESPKIASERDMSRSVRSKTNTTLSKIGSSSTSELASPKYDKYSRRSKSVSKAETSSSSSPLVDKLPTLSKVFSSSLVSEAGSDVGLRLNSPSASELAVVESPKTAPKRDLSRFVRSKATTTSSKLGASSTSELASPKYDKSRRSKSVSKVETSSSSSPLVDKLPILSKAFSSSLVSEAGSSSSPLISPKFQRVEAFVSPLHRRGASLSKLSLSSFANEDEGSKTSVGTKKSLLPKSLSSKEDRKDIRVKKLEALVSSPIGDMRKFNSPAKTEQKGLGSEEKFAAQETVNSPERHKFLRRQSTSETLKSPGRKQLTTRMNGEKSIENKKPIIEEDHQPNSTVKKVEIEEINSHKVSDQKTVTDEKNTIKAANATETSSHSASPAKTEANSTTKSTNFTRKISKRGQNLRQTPLFHEKYKTLRRVPRARSVVSEPMGPSNDFLSEISSADSCETDHVLEQKAMERVLASRINTNPRSTRRRASNNGGHKDEQPRKLKFRPGRVVEFKSEINSPRRLKFKRRSVPRNVTPPQSNVEMTMFGVLRKPGGRRDGSNNHHRVQFADDVDAEKVVLRHQEVQQAKGSQASLNNVIEETASKLVEDRKSKVKALVGAFESLMTLQDSKPIPTVIASS